MNTKKKIIAIILTAIIMTIPVLASGAHEEANAAEVTTEIITVVDY
ncbi:hypothetical protein SAMN02910369_00703 [Lachnospiraceae bacterium NE2001]|nr:hypothetical protein SAMN02910369_00703 [Lachnospiraceae bacterium NE2001]